MERAAGMDDGGVGGVGLVVRQCFDQGFECVAAVPVYFSVVGGYFFNVPAGFGEGRTVFSVVESAICGGFLLECREVERGEIVSGQGEGVGSEAD